MERVLQARFRQDRFRQDRLTLAGYSRKLGMALGVTLLALAPMMRAHADPVFPPPVNEDPTKGPVEVFPPSRFGMPPMHVNTGVGPDYASRAVADMEASDESDAVPDGSRASRSPAGLEFAKRGRTFYPPPSRDLDPVTTKRSSDEVLTLSHDPLPSEVAQRGVQEVAIIASDLGFFPRTIFVSRDVPVRLFVTGASKNTLCIMMDSFQIRKQVRSQKVEEVTFTPETPGKYRFYCPVNGMEGTMIVKELSTDPQSGRTGRSLARVNASDVLGD